MKLNAIAMGGAALALALLGLAAWRWALPGWAGHAAGPDEHIVYKRPGGAPLALHFFRPVGVAAGTAVPALVFFHGGGWQHGSAAQFHPQCRHFSQRGLACFSVAYRTAASHGGTPADALQDARDAMRHLRRHAQALGIVADRVLAGGGSAGGHLAAALGTAVPLPDPGHDPRVSTRPDALLLLNPMLDLSPGMPDHDRVADNWQALSPQQHVDAAVPPVLVLGGERDTEATPATLRAFCQAVRQAGQRCDLTIYPGAEHGFFNATVQGGRHAQATLQEIERFLASLGLPLRDLR